MGGVTADPPGLDLTALRQWLDGAVPSLLDGALSGELIAGGKSNLTYEVTDGSSWWIVRRPPMGHVLAKLFRMNNVEYRFDAIFTASESLLPEVRRQPLR